MSIYSKGMVDLKFQQTNTNITNIDNKIDQEINNRKGDIEVLINGGTTQEGDVVNNGITNINYTIYGNQDTDQKGLKDIIEETIPEGGLDPNKVMVTNAQGMIVPSDVSSDLLNTLSTLPQGVDMTQILTNSLKNIYKVAIDDISCATIPTSTEIPDTNSWYYINANAATPGNRDRIYLYRYYLNSNVNMKIVNLKDISVDYNIITGKNNLSGANLVLSLNNYSNIVGINWTKNGENTYGDNYAIDIYFFNRNQDNGWFENTAVNMYIQLNVLCGGL